jgi:iron-sulfur cluster assembly protein
MSELVLDPATPVITLTPAAVQQVKLLIQKRGNAKLCLRVGVKGGGCSGLSYVMNLEENPTERDLVYEIDGLKVMVDKKSARFIQGIVLDYTVKNLLEGGWKFTNPNAQRSCGCGTSFTPK